MPLSAWSFALVDVVLVPPRSRPATCRATDLAALHAELNADPRVHGILLQLPLPDHLATPR